MLAIKTYMHTRMHIRRITFKIFKESDIMTNI